MERICNIKALCAKVEEQTFKHIQRYEGLHTGQERKIIYPNDPFKDVKGQLSKQVCKTGLRTSFRTERLLKPITPFVKPAPSAKFCVQNCFRDNLIN